MSLPSKNRQFLVTLIFALLSMIISYKTYKKRLEITRIKLNLEKLKLDIKFTNPPKLMFAEIPVVSLNRSPATFYMLQEWENRIIRHRKFCSVHKETPTLIDQYKEFFTNGKYVYWKEEPMTLIDDIHKILMCTTPKSGSTNWRETFGIMINTTENETTNGTTRAWKSRKDKENYRIKRENEIHQFIEFSKRIESLDLDNDYAKNQNTIKNGKLNFPFKQKYVDEDIKEKFIFDLHNKSNNYYGHFPLDSIPASLRKPSPGRSGHVKLSNGYSYQDRIGVYTNKTYFKTVMVRHPLERLVSAYRDKKQLEYFRARPKNGFFGVPNLGLRKLMKDSSEVSEKLSEMDKFAFHSFIINNLFRSKTSWQTAGVQQRHWSQATFLCRLCSINWDFIAKLETIDVDSEYIMDVAGLEGKVSLGMHASKNGIDKVIRYFRGMPKSIFLKLYKIYESDFEILGYTVPHILWDSLINE